MGLAVNPAKTKVMTNASELQIQVNEEPIYYSSVYNVSIKKFEDLFCKHTQSFYNTCILSSLHGFIYGL